MSSHTASRPSIISICMLGQRRPLIAQDNPIFSSQDHISPSSHSLLRLPLRIALYASVVSHILGRATSPSSHKAEVGTINPWFAPWARQDQRRRSHGRDTLILETWPTRMSDIGMAASSSNKSAAWKYARLQEPEEAELEDPHGPSDRY
jgi:hypothetical protein